MMNEIEKEYKILLSEEQFNQLCNCYKDLKFIKQTNTYYDTKDRTIQQMHGAMRLREKDGLVIFTLKMHTSSGLMEHEGIVPYNDIRVFELPEILDILNLYKIHGPFLKTAVCITNRAVVESEYAELCFDKNLFHNEITDFEIEYEYKKDHDGFLVFNEILDQINISYTENCISKIKRALDSKKC